MAAKSAWEPRVSDGKPHRKLSLALGAMRRLEILFLCRLNNSGPHTASVCHATPSMSSLTIPNFLSLTTISFRLSRKRQRAFLLFFCLISSFFFSRSNGSRDNGVSLQMSVKHERAAEQWENVSGIRDEREGTKHTDAHTWDHKFRGKICSFHSTCEHCYGKRRLFKTTASVWSRRLMKRHQVLVSVLWHNHSHLLAIDRSLVRIREGLLSLSWARLLFFFDDG